MNKFLLLITPIIFFFGCATYQPVSKNKAEVALISPGSNAVGNEKGLDVLFDYTHDFFWVSKIEGQTPLSAAGWFSSASGDQYYVNPGLREVTIRYNGMRGRGRDFNAYFLIQCEFKAGVIYTPNGGMKDGIAHVWIEVESTGEKVSEVYEKRVYEVRTREVLIPIYQ